MLIRVNVVQVCDATTVDSSNAAGKIKIIRGDCFGKPRKDFDKNNNN